MRFETGENLVLECASELWGELGAAATGGVMLGVGPGLSLPQGVARGEVEPVHVSDAELGQPLLQPAGVREGVLVAADSASAADVAEDRGWASARGRSRS